MHDLLSSMHNLNTPLLHCDLKPDNIMLCTDDPKTKELVKLIDFGISGTRCGTGTPNFVPFQMSFNHVDVFTKITEEDYYATIKERYYNRITEDKYKTIIGTINVDKLRGEDVSTQYDMWALGLILMIILGDEYITEYQEMETKAMNLLNWHNSKYNETENGKRQRTGGKKCSRYKV